ncbi:methyltransferase domain-containing protein [Synechococcus sp. CCY9201]|uniref:methyltransferase domain-containing protein n=1 Tax=unclassified Synechococcus TaxID=2626047 RepID=UPI002B1F0E12|nr:MULTISPECIES: methyltransferase domain-containing protein [unclassified Synechococcus]MEA5424909.1 methyltransferase domain-containing protein [Synechococcus sp. CCY9202]MEA5474556.1 methyltransferase domain-containing protein [Synechococcus sp. CCY9201]
MTADPSTCSSGAAELTSVVRQYYGSTLTSSDDLRTTACCDATAVPPELRPLLARLHPEVLSRYYGCGLVAPPLLEGARVLDLGCGSGRDAYLLAQLVGPSGEVVGVDMTPEQLAVANRHREYHAEQFGYANVRFVAGIIEQLDQLHLEPASFDLVISNCVVNLSTDKLAVLQGVRQLLKPGGEFYFADVYADRRIPEALRQDPVLYGECLSGALYWNDFRRLAQQAGFLDPRLVADRPLAITDPDLAAKTGEIRFFSATYRLFRIDGLEDACEDHGQAVIYRGTIPAHPHLLRFDQHHAIETGRVFPVCGNTYRMLAESRLAPHFSFIGDFSHHYGLFPGCGGALPFTSASTGSACC